MREYRLSFKHTGLGYIRPFSSNILPYESEDRHGA